MNENTKFSEVIAEWLTEKQPMVEKSTHAAFVLHAENHLIPKFGDMEISSITESDVQSFVNELFTDGRMDGKGGLSLKTIQDVVLVLRLTMNYAYKRRMIPPLNWKLIEYPKDTEIHTVISLSKEEERELIQKIYMELTRKSAGILVVLLTGLRIGEICGLKMSDISIADGTIKVNRTVQRIYDKKTCTSYIHVGTPKTRKSIRTIPIPSLLSNVIKKYLISDQDAYFLTGTAAPTEPRTYRQYFARFLSRNELKKCKFHELRHTFAVRCMEIPEFDIKSLSEILGHKSVSFTLNVYGSANLYQKTKCMNLLNDLL